MAPSTSLDSCLSCGNDKYLDPSVVLFLSPCGHSLCKACVDKLFSKGAKAAPCPTCQTLIQKEVFIEQASDAGFVRFGRENGIRKRLSKQFNKRREDFPTLRAYNDYLEEIEDIVFNLTNGLDVDKTNARIEVYVRENQDLINRNLAKKAAERRATEDILAEERRQMQQRLKTFQAEKESEEEKRAEEQRQKEAMLDGLAKGTVSVEQVRARQRAVTSELKRPSRMRRRKDEEDGSKPVVNGDDVGRFKFETSLANSMDVDSSDWTQDTSEHAPFLPASNPLVAEYLDGPFETAQVRRSIAEALSSCLLDMSKMTDHGIASK